MMAQLRSTPLPPEQVEAARHATLMSLLNAVYQSDNWTLHMAKQWSQHLDLNDYGAIAQALNTIHADNIQTAARAYSQAPWHWIIAGSTPTDQLVNDFTPDFGTAIFTQQNMDERCFAAPCPVASAVSAKNDW